MTMRRRRFFMMIMLLATMFATSALFGCKTTEERAVPNVDAMAPKVSKEPAWEVKEAEEAMKAAEAQKAAEAKMVEEERKAVEEAKNIVIARVNGADINMFMLVRTMNRVAAKYVKKDEATTPEMTKKIQQEALDRLIFEELAVQEAIKQGINPTPEAIEKVVAQVKENAGSEQAYKEYLDKAFLTEETLKKLIERSQRFELISARELYGKVKVDEKLIKDEYEKEKGKFVLPDNFVVEDVLFLQGKDEETTRKKAGEVLETIRKNDNDVWKLVQDGTFIVRKIKITKEKYPEIYKTMTDMKAGDLSGVIKDKDSYHIIKVVKKEFSRQSTFEEARPVIEPRFLVPAQDQRKEEWGKELRKDAKIEILTEEIERNLNEAAGKQEKEK
jgi:peptidyl-prolyl cis-trans isomerase C